MSRGLLCAAALSSCAHAAATRTGPPLYGLRKSTPAEVCLPPGAQLWLSRLRCPDGAPVQIVSQEPIGPRNEPESPDDPRLLAQLDAGRPLARGEPDLHLVNQVVVSCSDGDRTLYIDMYHCNQPPPDIPPDGLSIAPPPPAPDRD